MSAHHARAATAALTAALAVAALTGCASRISGQPRADIPTTPVSVTLVLHDAATALDCAAGGVGGYDDIGEGADVTLTDQTGEIIASGSLDPGTADSADAAACDFTATLTDVPADRTQYQVSVSHRGQITHSYPEMVSEGWAFTLTLGSAATDDEDV